LDPPADAPMPPSINIMTHTPLLRIIFISRSLLLKTAGTRCLSVHSIWLLCSRWVTVGMWLKATVTIITMVLAVFCGWLLVYRHPHDCFNRLFLHNAAIWLSSYAPTPDTRCIH
jgi:hypothetical protein